MRTFTVSFVSPPKKVQAAKGDTLLDAAIKAGIGVNAACGGEGLCGKCVMRVRKGNVEKIYLGKISRQDIQNGFVLACATRIIEDVEVEIPASVSARNGNMEPADAERFSRVGDEPEDYGKHPLVTKARLELDIPTLENNSSDHERVSDAVCKRFGVPYVTVALDLVKEIPATLRTSDFDVTAVVGFLPNGFELIDVEQGNTAGRCFIAVVDIGTTTVVVHQVDARTAKTAASAACFNSQASYGAEVTTRIIAAEKKGVELLSSSIIADINRLVAETTVASGIVTNDIYAIVCAGNTVMIHFLLGLPVANIRRHPYIPASVQLPAVRVKDAGISINPRGICLCMPGISGWIGGDITAGILFTKMHRNAEVSMLVDIGTNGEIVVGCSEWLIATSASAGPALEGASIGCGIRAEQGAISSVYIENGRVSYSTIGDEPAKGICGSGIIDLVSVLLGEGIIDRTGRFMERSKDNVEEHDGVKRYVLASEDKAVGGRLVYITEPDIANVITAKAAIYAAMKILLRRIETEFGRLSRLYIGGAFGNYINKESAIRIGLLPDMSREKIEFAGNTSLKGAKIAAFSKSAQEELAWIRKITTAYDLMGADDYVEEFRKAMFLPHTDIEEFGA